MRRGLDERRRRLMRRAEERRGVVVVGGVRVRTQLKSASKVLPSQGSRGTHRHSSGPGGKYAGGRSR